ncbi:MAG TPA: hypothetical protein VMD08_17950 [Candidatus Baltobacteraceae bacterium]|nr:hypothetical protein [Candidatus Baltobacteraceae bacterium]
MTSQPPEDWAPSPALAALTDRQLIARGVDTLRDTYAAVGEHCGLTPKGVERALLGVDPSTLDGAALSDALDAARGILAVAQLGGLPLSDAVDGAERLAERGKPLAPLSDPAPKLIRDGRAQVRRLAAQLAPLTQRPLERVLTALCGWRGALEDLDAAQLAATAADAAFLLAGLKAGRYLSTLLDERAASRPGVAEYIEGR